MSFGQQGTPEKDVPEFFKPILAQAFAALLPRLGQQPQPFPLQRTAPASNLEALALGRLGGITAEGRNRIAPTTGGGAFGGADLSQVLKNL